MRSAEPRSASSTIKKNGRSVARNIALDKYPLDWCICKKCDLSEYEKKGDGVSEGNQFLGMLSSVFNHSTCSCFDFKLNFFRRRDVADVELESMETAQ